MPASRDATARLPGWVTNATVDPGGSVFLFTPDTFERYRITHYTHNAEKPRAIEDLFDGGLSDNLGITMAVRLLEHCTNKRKVLFAVDAYKRDTEPFSEHEESTAVVKIGAPAIQVSLNATRSHHRWMTDRLVAAMCARGEDVAVI